MKADGSSEERAWKMGSSAWSEMVSELPGHLSERVRVVREGVRGGSAGAAGGAGGEGEFVLCWLHHAIRVDENAALDVGRVMAMRLGLPLVVYQGLGGRHRFNSDRHFTFIMEGGRELWGGLRELDGGIRSVFHLPRDPSRVVGAGGGGGSPLHRLAGRAALVVTEDFPAPPFPRWTERLAAGCGRPTWAVDCACVVPMRLVEGEHLRAFRFRSKTEGMFKARAGRGWPTVTGEVRDGSGIDVGFEPVDWEGADIAALCASCEIDHSVPAVGHTRGGGRAGYARWEAFKARGLAEYHKRRNHAEIERDRLAVSRMSAYIHHGHVSPLRLVREAFALLGTRAGEGAAKYIDEIWVWRELAHHLCARYPHLLESTEIIPAWARRTLEEHRRDPREVKSWEALARGRSGDALWDAAQRSLLAHGELHNNVRMTWGKAIVGWSDGAARALRMLIDLNHRFALDGNNPNSYGGLLWCLGLLDSPFDGVDEPVTGCLRPRPLREHAGRMDLGRYVRGVRETSWGEVPRIAVVGGGMSGMAAARTLADQNASVVVFDKGRGPGGRMSTRRQEGARFDHGAQYFTVRDERFGRVVASWVEEGVVSAWRGRIGEVREPGRVMEKAENPVRYVGVPGMNAVVSHMVDTLGGDSSVRFGVRVERVRRVPGGGAGGGGWLLVDERGGELGVFDAVVLAVPGPQVAGLFEEGEGARAWGGSMRPCWAAMATFDRRLELEHDGVFVNVEGSGVSWAARDSSKPGRPTGESWVIHGSAAWSEEQLERSAEEVGGELVGAFLRAVGLEGRTPTGVTAHRWRYAISEGAVPGGCEFDATGLLAACGDWCHGGRVEGAYLSGVAAAGRVLAELVRRGREKERKG